jgi:tetratricopeptide (TPR) repeat protein
MVVEKKRKKFRLMSDKLPERRGYIISPDSYIAIGNRQSQIGNYPSALAAYNRAVRIAPSYARAITIAVRLSMPHWEM